MAEPQIVVEWNDEQDRLATPHADAVFRDAQAEIEAVWARLPLSARLLICSLNSPYKASLYHAEPGEPDGDKEGRARLGEVLLNTDCFKRNVAGKLRFAWTVSHEFAHAYQDMLRFWGCAGYAEWSRQGKVKESPHLRFVFSELGLPEEIGRRLHELYADATALAWGFGREYAETIIHEDFWPQPDELDEYEGHLLPHIVAMYQFMKEREIKDGTLDENYIQLRRPSIPTKRRKAMGARRKTERRDM